LLVFRPFDGDMRFIRFARHSGFYHDARFPTLQEVVNHYDSCMSLGLPEQENRVLEGTSSKT
jgi:hypothetical protein